MAVKYIASIHNYSGLSSDTKPTTDVPVGSVFSETDLGTTYRFDGTNWNLVFPAVEPNCRGALLTISHREYEVHRGVFFSATHAQSIGDGSVSTILFETPGSATATIHSVAELASSGAGTLLFSETPNATVGTVITGYSNNRTIGGSSELSLTYDGAVTTTGTILEHTVIGTEKGAKIGGEVMGDNEWVLNHSTRYLLQFTASAASNIAWNIFWIECSEN